MSELKVRLDGVDLETLGLPPSSTARFYITKPIGRGLPGVKRHALNLGFIHGERAYGLFYEAREIVIEGTLYAPVLTDYVAALDMLKRLVSPKHAATGFISEIAPHSLWFSDESTAHQGYAQAGAASTITLAATASSVSQAYRDFRVEVLNGSNAGEFHPISDYNGSTKVTTIVGRWSVSPSSTTLYRVTHDRYWRVHFDGELNEELLHLQWVQNKQAEIRLRFKADEPFSVSEPKTVEYARVGSAAGFASIENLGSFPTFPKVTVTGSCSNPRFVHAVHGFVASFNGDLLASDLLTTTVSPDTQSHVLAYDTGKNAQAVGIAGRPGLQMGAHDFLGFNTMSDSGAPNTASSGFLRVAYTNHFDSRQGTIAWWQRSVAPMSATVSREAIPILDTGSSEFRLSFGGQDSQLNSIALDPGDIDLADAGAWSHYAITWDRSLVVNGSNRIQTYRNGSAVAGSTSAQSPMDMNKSGGVPVLSMMTLLSSLGRFSGQFDDFAIWDVPLSGNEIGSLAVTEYTHDTMRPEALKVYLPIDGSGTLTDGRNADMGACWDRDENMVAVNATTCTLDPLGGRGFYATGGANLVNLYVTDATTIFSEIGSVTAVGSHALTVAFANNAIFSGRGGRVARNLVADGDMEVNSAGYWVGAGATSTIAKVSTSVKGGLRCLTLATLANSVAYATQVMSNAVSGQDFLFSGWAGPGNFAVAPTSGETIVGVTSSDGYITVGTQPYSHDVWQSYEMAFQASGANPQVLLSEIRPVNTFAISWDNVKVMQNWLDNGGLQGTYSGGVAENWTASDDGAPTYTEENSVVHSGGAAQKVVKGDGTYAGISQVVTLTSGQWYCFSAWIRATTGAVSVRLVVGLTTKGFATGAANGWQKLSWIWKEATGGSIAVRVEVLDNATVYFDDVAIIWMEGVDLLASPASLSNYFVPAETGKGIAALPTTRLAYSSGTYVANPIEGGMVTRFRALFPSSTADTGTHVIAQWAGSASNYALLTWEGSLGAFQMRWLTPSSQIDVQSARQFFGDGESLEIGARWNADTRNDSRTIAMYLNGTLIGSYTSAIGSMTTLPASIYLGEGTNGVGNPANVVLDEVAFFVKDPTEAHLLELFHRKRGYENDNFGVLYSGTLSDGDQWVAEPQIATHASKVQLYDASAGTLSNALGSTTFYGGMVPILSESRAILFFPSALAGVLRLDYDARWL